MHGMLLRKCKDGFSFTWTPSSQMQMYDSISVLGQASRKINTVHSHDFRVESVGWSREYAVMFVVTRSMLALVFDLRFPKRAGCNFIG